MTGKKRPATSAAVQYPVPSDQLSPERRAELLRGAGAVNAADRAEAAAAKPPARSTSVNGANSAPPHSENGTSATGATAGGRVGIPPADTSFPGWLTKEEASQFTGLAIRTLERMAERGEIQQATRRNGLNKRMTVYHPGDCERVRAETMARVPVPRPLAGAPKNGTMATVVAGLDAAVLGAVTSALERLERIEQKHLLPPPADAAPRPATVQVPISEKLCLTLKEAIAYSGLGEAFVLEKFRSGRWPGRKVGGEWRIRRADLERAVAEDDEWK